MAKIYHLDRIRDIFVVFMEKQKTINSKIVISKLTCPLENSANGLNESIALDMILNLKNQVYEEVIEDCRKHGKLFVDKTFPANKSSLGKVNQKVEWHRPKELYESPVFLEETSPEGIRQSFYLSNCWFAAAISALMDHRTALEFTTPNGQGFADKQYFGVFRFRFNQHGTRIEVVVDDQLPFVTENGQRTMMAMGNALNPIDFWLPLIEKAYAKIRGGYWTMNFGLPSEAMGDLMDGLPEKLNLRLKSLTSEWIRTHIERTISEGGIIVGSTISSENTVRANEIANNHSYSIHRAEKVSFGTFGSSLILLKNPWSDGTTWSGKWAWKDFVWQQIGSSERLLLGFENFEKSGMFWMEATDFIAQFDTVDFIHRSPGSLVHRNPTDCISTTEWVTSYHWGIWLSENRPNGSRTFWENPRTIFRIESSSKSTYIYLRLNQMYRRQNKHHEQHDFEFIQLILCRTKTSIEMPLKWITFNTPANFELIATSGPYCNLREISILTTITDGWYIVLSCLKNVVATKEFILTVTSEASIQFFDLSENALESLSVTSFMKVDDIKNHRERILKGDRVEEIDVFDVSKNEVRSNSSVLSDIFSDEGMNEPKKKISRWSKFKKRARKAFGFLWKGLQRMSCLRPLLEFEK
ncbi:hypothetical protein ACOME3_002852 [Neoechinorhynchus agilis]